MGDTFESSVGFDDVGTRALALGEIMKALKDLDIKRIGVYGMAGVGKTMFVEEVARKSMQEGLFNAIVMVTVSQSFNLQTIDHKEIAWKFAPKRLHEKSLSALADRLQDEFQHEEKLLIIVEDLWKKPELEIAKIYFDKNNQKGWKILLISRNRYVLHDHMGVEKNIKVELLSKPEAMDLFDKVVGAKSKEPNFRDLATAIVEKCGYLPVAIKPIAYALKDRDISAWRTALDKMKSSLRHGGAYLSTKTSYEFLSDDGKMILLLCAQHREGENISVEDLVNIYVAICWDARNVDTLQDARDEVHTLVKNLKGYGLLFDGDEDGSVKLHDVTREIIVSIGMEDKSMYCLQNFKSLTHTLIKSNHDPSGISLLGDDFNQFPDDLPCSRLKLLLMHQGIYESNFQPILFPRAFLEKAKELRAFCLRSVIVQPLPLSPNSLQNLQTLSLNNCVLKDIAFIGELENLVVLDLSNSKFEQLPEQIGKLTCLRQLNLNYCSDLKVIQPNAISHLIRLEELYMDYVYVEWGEEAVGGESNASLVEVKNLPRLSALHLYILDACVLPDDMFVDGKLKRFNIIVGRLDRELHPLERSSRLLHFNRHESSRLYENDFQMLMKMSEVLCLNTLPEVTCGLPLFKEELAFPNRLPAGSPMSNLTKLNVTSCMNLKHVFASAIVGSLTQLEDLVITHCPAMKEIIAADHGTSSQKFLLPKLTSLELARLESLKTFCGGDSKVVLNNLKKLEISDCDSLASLCDLVSLESRHQLTKLGILNCYLMEAVFVMKESGNEERKPKKISFPKLEHLSLVFVPNLKRFLFCEADYSIEFPSLLKLDIYGCDELRTFIAKSTSTIEKQVEEIPFNREVAFSNMMLSGITFGNLQDFTISGCKNIQYLFSFEMVESLKHLKMLQVDDCSVMEQIITKPVGKDGRLKNISFPKLKFLSFGALPELKRFCEGDHIECPSLSQLEIYDCRKFRTFIPNSTSAEEGEPVAQQPLFNEKVVLLNLEELHVSNWEKDVNELWPRQFSTVLFPKLKVLQLERPSGFLLSKILRFKNLETIDLWGCLEKNIWQHEEYGQTLTHLRRLELDKLPKLKHLFKDPAENIQLVHQTVPNLETIIVRQCDKLKTLVMSSSFSFENLAVLELSKCHGLVNLFDSSIAKSLIQLKTMEISECNQLIQVIDDVNEMEDQSKIVFSRLETLTLCDLRRLQSFFSGKNDLEFPKLEKLIVTKCPDMANFSHGMSINSPNLEINTDNASIKKLWESQDDSSETVAFSNMMLFGITFGNLQDFTISGCKNLQYLLPFEMVESLKHLKMLQVDDCSVMEQIITKPVGGEDGRIKNISFPKLVFLCLRYLPKLKRFCEGDRIECPSLLEIEIVRCSEFKTFIPNSTSVEESEPMAQQPLFNEKVVLTNLEELHVSDWGKDVNELWPRQFSTVLFPKLKVLQLERPSGFLLYEILRFKNLETIYLWGCLEENIWQHEEYCLTLTHLRRILLGELPKLKHLFEDPYEIHQTVPNLESLVVYKCDRLKTLVISSSFSFENLAVLELSKCHKLVNLFDSSVAKSLVQLKTMEISECNKLIQVIDDVNKMEDQSKIVFRRLDTLTLQFLCCLQSFSAGKNGLEFPNLEKLTVIECPEMTIFSHGMSINSLNLKINTDNASIISLWESQGNSSVTGRAKTPVSSTTVPNLEKDKNFVEASTSNLKDQVKTPEVEKDNISNEEIAKQTLKEQLKTPEVMKAKISKKKATTLAQEKQVKTPEVQKTQVAGDKSQNNGVALEPIKRVSPPKSTLGDGGLNGPELSDKKRKTKDEDTPLEKAPEAVIEEEIYVAIHRLFREDGLESPPKPAEPSFVLQEQEAKDKSEEANKPEEVDKEDSSEDGVEMDEDEPSHAKEEDTKVTNVGTDIETPKRRFSAEEKGKGLTKSLGITPPSWHKEAECQFMERFDGPECSPIEAEDLFDFSGEKTTVRGASVPVEVASILSQVLDKHPEIIPPSTSSRLRSYICTRLGNVFLGMVSFSTESVTDVMILAWRDVCRELSFMGSEVSFIVNHLGKIALKTFQDRCKNTGRIQMKLQIEKLEEELATLKQAYQMTYGKAPGSEAKVPNLFEGLI